MATLKYKNGNTWDTLEVGGNPLDAWPVNSHYMTTGNSPATIIGGTWSQINAYSFGERGAGAILFSNSNYGSSYSTNYNYAYYRLIPLDNNTQNQANIGNYQVALYRRTA